MRRHQVDLVKDKRLGDDHDNHDGGSQEVKNGDNDNDDGDDESLYFSPAPGSPVVVEEGCTPSSCGLW